MRIFLCSIFITFSTNALVDFCDQENIFLKRTWIGGLLGTNNDAYGPSWVNAGRCQQLVKGHYIRLDEQECLNMVHELNDRTGRGYACAQLGYNVDPYTGKDRGNRCYACY